MSKKVKIDVDEDVFQFLQDNAEAFVDTPNDVLRRLLLSQEVDAPASRRPKMNKRDSVQNVDAFVVALLSQEFGGHLSRRGRYRLMFESNDAVVYVQNFNKVSSHLWYRITDKPWKELREESKRSWICFTNPPEQFAYVIPVDDIQKKVVEAGYDRNHLEVNIDPVSSRWIELQWNISQYRTQVASAA